MHTAITLTLCQTLATQHIKCPTNTGNTAHQMSHKHWQHSTSTVHQTLATHHINCPPNTGNTLHELSTKHWQHITPTVRQFCQTWATHYTHCLPNTGNTSHQLSNKGGVTHPINCPQITLSQPLVHTNYLK